MENNEERRAQCVLHEERISHISKKVDDIHKILVGNGKIGLCAKVDFIYPIIMIILGGIGVKVGAMIWKMVEGL